MARQPRPRRALSFLPGVMLAMVAIFPHRQLGVELGSILLIFTGQVWNIAFSFYSSLKTQPREMCGLASSRFKLETQTSQSARAKREPQG